MKDATEHGTDDPASIVVAGFEPFGGRTRNRSWDVIRRLGDRQTLQTLQLPVDRGPLEEVLSRLMAGQPRRLLLVGEAPMDVVCVEQVALNIYRPIGEEWRGRLESQPLVKNGPLAIASPWDGDGLARQLNRDGIPAVLSFHAGTFACNGALYLALNGCGERCQVGLLHIPYRRWPLGMKMHFLVRAVTLALDALQPRPPHQSSGSG